ncbi:receptor protein kinase-like protein ZAR1 [Salvia divinorum]|uniref:Receptor protein kinase-like protein ZAR1 n=1 Tax=Salvia divinorum TaxID=28513 RepID=A0ABD1H3Z1_SALDI
MRSINALFNIFYLSTFCIALSSSLNADGLSLLALKAAILKDPNMALISWLEVDSTPCRWPGIACDRAHRRVISVSLPSKNLTGYIPSEIGALSFLVFLDLSHNFFSGPLPHQIAALQNLVHYYISSNNFNGSLLEGLSNLTRLQGTLNLSYNAFSGEILARFRRVLDSFQKRWKLEQKLGKESVGVGEGLGGEEGKKGKFVVIDEGFGLELEDLLRASAYVLGKSRSGIVYRVVAGGRKGMAAAPVVVDVRRLSEGDVAWSLKEFEAEVETIRKVRHPNIVGLRAYYYASDEKLLIADFISNGSLYTVLHGGAGNVAPPLSWAARLRIIQETARGLMHIHNCSPRKYVHGSLKSSKILLDDDLKAYISGFGLSHLVPAISKSATAPSRKPNLLGTPKTWTSSNIMCVAPEAQGSDAKVNQKCDVYAFGILVMEILTGQAPDNDGEEWLESRVRRIFREERPLSVIIDPTLLNEVRAKKQVVATFHVSLNCTERDPELRQKMRTVSYNLDRIKLQ